MLPFTPSHHLSVLIKHCTEESVPSIHNPNPTVQTTHHIGSSVLQARGMGPARKKQSSAPAPFVPVSQNKQRCAPTPGLGGGSQARNSAIPFTVRNCDSSPFPCCLLIIFSSQPFYPVITFLPHDHIHTLCKSVTAGYLCSLPWRHATEQQRKLLLASPLLHYNPFKSIQKSSLSFFPLCSAASTPALYVWGSGTL